MVWETRGRREYCSGGPCHGRHKREAGGHSSREHPAAQNLDREADLYYHRFSILYNYENGMKGSIWKRWDQFSALIPPVSINLHKWPSTLKSVFPHQGKTATIVRSVLGAKSEWPQWFANLKALGKCTYIWLWSTERAPFPDWKPHMEAE